MKAVILDQGTFGASVDWSPLLQLPLDWTCHTQTSNAQCAQRIAGAQIVMCNKVPLNCKVMAKAPDLKYIGVLATGTNNIDLKAAEERGIRVKNVEGYGTASVAQHTLMLMLNLATQFNRYQQDVKAGAWQRASSFCLIDHPITELSGKHLVIVGYGELGQAVVSLAKAFGMRVTVAARPGTQPERQRPALDEVLPHADVVSLHCLLSEDTLGLFNARRIARMKPSAFLINTARGPLVDEMALVDALERQHLGGAALDVLVDEPPKQDSVILQCAHPNLIVTPHNAWASDQAQQRLIEIAAAHLQGFIA